MVIKVENQETQELNTNGALKGKKRNKKQNAGKGKPQQASPIKNKGNKEIKTEAKEVEGTPATNGVNNKRKSPEDQPQNLEGSKKRRRNKKNKGEKGTNVTGEQKPAGKEQQKPAGKGQQKPAGKGQQKPAEQGEGERKILRAKRKSLSQKRDTYTEYLNSWKNDKSKWTFNSITHSNLALHAFDMKTVPASQFPVLIEYLTETKDKSSERVKKEGKEIAEKMMERSKKILSAYQ